MKYTYIQYTYTQREGVEVWRTKERITVYSKQLTAVVTWEFPICLL